MTVGQTLVGTEEDKEEEAEAEAEAKKVAEQEEAGLLARGFSNRRLELKTEAGAGAAETDTCLRAGHGLAGWSCDGQHVLELRRRHVLIPRGQGPHKRVGVSAVR